jgi:osmotically-inducible protein OsmY
MPRSPLRFASLLVLAGLCLSLAACGEGREEKLQRASQELQAARQEVRKLREEVKTKEEKQIAAEQELMAARKSLNEAESRLSDAESKVDLKATDEFIFRTVQKRLLEDKKLRDTAISATVDHGIVTLHGRVSDEQLVKYAMDLTRETPGVAGVESEIQVAEAKPSS